MAGLGQTKTGQKAITALDRERQALELRKAGLGLEQIATQLGYHQPAGAYKAIKRALARSVQEPAEELRELELARLDKMLSSHWPAVLKGHVRSTEVAIRIMERRAALIGLDAPKEGIVNLNATSVVRLIGVAAEDI